MTGTAATTRVEHPTPHARVEARSQAGAAELGAREYRLAVGTVAAAAAAFLLLRLRAWPPHEDEALALFVGRSSLGELLDTVLGERGGAPLHFVLAWVVAHLDGGLTGLRLLSALFAVASVPVLAALATRLGGRTAGALAAAVAAASWVFLFHGIYARMYSLFLVTSALSYLVLLRALERGGRRAWALWAGALLTTVAVHPYGALVFASQGLYVLLVRVRLREAALAFAATAALGTPFWIADLVLAGRFDVGLGPGGKKLGDPLSVLGYFGRVAGDFSVGWLLALPAVLLLAATGAVLLARRNRSGALLAGSAVAVPAAAFLVARLGSSAAPETRHLIFVLPFFALALSLPLVRLAETGRRGLAVASVAVLLAGEVAWGWSKTGALFTGDARAHAAGRDAASAWLAATGRPDDVLLGYEPVFLGAWERSERFSRLVLPRADARLAAEGLREGGRPLGRGVWIFDAYDTNNFDRRLAIGPRRPRPAEAFDVRAFGPYLVVRTRDATGTPRAYLQRAAQAQVLGRALGLGDADINLQTVGRAAGLLGYEASRAPSSRSTSSR